MDSVFLDTSAFLKLYVNEIGASWLRNFVIGQQIIISELAFFESITALRAKFVNGQFTKIQATRTYAQIYKTRGNYTVISVDRQSQLPKLASVTFNLPINMRLRALDAIQLIAAIGAERDTNIHSAGTLFTFVSSDAQLLRVAQSQGFTTENPEDHP